ncbi:peptidase S8 [halophilic archaeon]|nr:peptidase S8 [halophilic archaeon]
MTETEIESNTSRCSRRQLLKAGAAVTGTASLSGFLGIDPSAIVPVNIGYKDERGLDAAIQAASNVARTFEFNALTIELPEWAASQQGLSTLGNKPGIRYIERDRQMQALGQSLPWGVDRVDAEVAYQRGKTGADADIAIIDTGIDSTHPDLSANLGQGDSFTYGMGNLLSDQQKSRIHSRRSTINYDLYPDWQDDNGHGTHCAGIANAVNNKRGVVGVSTEATLHPVKVLTAIGAGSTSDIVAGIEYTANQGWDVASLSLGGSSSNLLRDACQYAYNQGVLLVAATGNSGPCTDCVGYPAAYPNVLGVSATTQNDTLASFSSTGPEVDLAAPGKNIRSTYLSFLSDYKQLSGTSMAAPHVSGASAQLMANGRSRDETVQQLKETAEDIGLSSAEAGAGLLDVAAALDLTT